MASPPCARPCLKCAISPLAGFCRFLPLCGRLFTCLASTTASPSLSQRPGRFEPRAAAARVELASPSTILVPIHPCAVALGVLSGPLHARAGGLAPRRGVQAAPTTSTCTGTPLPGAMDDLSARPAAQASDPASPLSGCSRARERSLHVSLAPTGTLVGGARLPGGRGDLPPLLGVPRGLWSPLEPVSARHSHPQSSPLLLSPHPIFACSYPPAALRRPSTDGARCPARLAGAPPPRAPPPAHRRPRAT